MSDLQSNLAGELVLAPVFVSLSALVLQLDNGNRGVCVRVCVSWAVHLSLMRCMPLPPLLTTCRSIL